MGSAAMIGPILGGGLIALNLFGSGWRMVFLINLPVGTLAVLAGTRSSSRASSLTGATRRGLLCC
jgi:MFS family permease